MSVFLYSNKLSFIFGKSSILSRNLIGLAKNLELYKDNVLKKVSQSVRYLYHRNKYKNLIVVNFAIGGPVTGVVAEELFSRGVNEILIVSTAGVINTKLGLGEIVICNKAVRDEGVSHHYLKNSTYVLPDKKFVNRIIKMVGKLDVKPIIGPTWTIDAPYRETVREIMHYTKKGMLTVEMEAASLFAIAKVRKRRAAAVFTISDILDAEKNIHPTVWTGFDVSRKIRMEHPYPILIKIIELFDKY